VFSKTVRTVFAAMLWQASAVAQAQPASKPTVKYGSNAAVGKTFTHDGVKLYYEVYGTGEPVLLIHGNGGNIASMTAQIMYFRNHYQVIAMDSRDQGKSGDSPDKITYEKMADDQAALLDHLKSRPVNVIGWSDGGIEALLLGIRHPEKVKKLASMAANLNPQGVYPEAEELSNLLSNSIPAAAKDSSEAKRQMKVSQMMQDEPHIAPEALEAIKTPTLILAGDHDLIRDEHTLEIYHHLPNSQLCIFPNATHMIPIDDPELFNTTVDRFFRTPFEKKDRIKDLIKTVQRLMAEQH
jgi:pimeloyl-ACP methyl ester carboxylesterase